MPKISLLLFRSCVAVLLGCAAQYALAISLFDLRADVLMMRLPELEKNLNLNANQKILWQQSEAKTKTLLRAKEMRHIKVDSAVRDMIQKPDVELRDIDARLSEEAQASSLDDQKGREIWLTVFDALDDKQRVLVQNFLYEQLMESGDIERPSSSNPDAPAHKGHGGRGAGGAGGAGSPGTGASTTF